MRTTHMETEKDQTVRWEEKQNSMISYKLSEKSTERGMISFIRQQSKMKTAH